MMFFKKKAIKETTTPIYDRDMQLLLLLKSVNLTDKTLLKVNELGYEVMDAEIELIGTRMAERRATNLEKALSNN